VQRLAHAAKLGPKKVPASGVAYGAQIECLLFCKFPRLQVRLLLCLKMAPCPLAAQLNADNTMDRTHTGPPYVGRFLIQRG